MRLLTSSLGLATIYAISIIPTGARAENLSAQGVSHLFELTDSVLGQLRNQFSPLPECDYGIPSPLGDDPCNELRQISCAPSGSIGFDSTGFSSRKDMPLVEDFKIALFQQVKPAMLSALNKASSYRKELNTAMGYPPAAPLGDEQIRCFLEYLEQGLHDNPDWGGTESNEVPTCFKGSSAAKASLLKDKQTKAIFQESRKIGQDVFSSNPLYENVRDNIFPKVQEAVEEAIRRRFSGSPAREKAISLVASQRLTNHCDDGDPLAMDAGHYRVPGENQGRVGICFGMLNACTSAFCLVHVLAHELGHSLEPCGNTNFVGNDRSLEAYIFRDAAECLVRKSPYKPLSSRNTEDICANTFLNEEFADLVAQEALPIYLTKNVPQVKTAEQFRAGYANVWRWACSDPNSPATATHPSTPSRVDMLMSQPAIRNQMGCKSIPPFESCSLSGRAQ